MATEEAAAGGSGKLVIKNVGLMLSGDITAPILDADAIVANDGRITAIGRAGDLDFSGATATIDANGVTLRQALSTVMSIPLPAIGLLAKTSSDGLTPACTAALRP